MSLSRSRFGRQTHQKPVTTSSYTFNLTESFVSLLNETTGKILANTSPTLTSLNKQILEFYSYTIRLLSTEPSSSSTNHSLSNLTSITQGAINLPECVLILFCVLFGIHCEPFGFGERLNSIRNQHMTHIHLIQQSVLRQNPFMCIFKIGIFMRVVRMLFETEPVKDDVHHRRLTDLMRSEFSVFKFDDGANDHAVQANFSLLLSSASQLLFKHMSEDELERFVY
jgi:hypothetical protein